jgi:tetratricopeptide (TPR) repeat protein
MPPPLARFANWRRAHRRPLARAYLLLCGVLVLSLAIDAAGLGVGDALVRWWSARWVRRIDAAEQLMHEGEAAGAVSALERLELEFPARHVAHALGHERVRLLVALGHGYEQTGRADRARETFAALARFAPHDPRGHYELGACLVRQNRAAEAEAPLRAALATHPTHLPSLSALVQILFDAGRFAEVRALWQTYVDATLLADVDLELGGRRVTVSVPVDGASHPVRAPLDGSGGALTVRTPGYAIGIDSARAIPLQLAGRRVDDAPTRLARWRLAAMREVAPGLYAPRGVDAALTSSERIDAASAIELTLRLCKPIDAATWQRVEQSFRSLDDSAGLAAVQGRTAVMEDS